MGVACDVDGDIYFNGDIIGYTGSTCNDDGYTYEGIEYVCSDGDVIENDYNGDCNEDKIGSSCCQLGAPGTAGGASCELICDIFFIPSTTMMEEESMLDCDYVQYEPEVYYSGRDLLERIQKPIGVCHTDVDISGVNSSVIFSCTSDGSGVEIDYYDNQQCLGTPSNTETLSDLMTAKG